MTICAIAKGEKGEREGREEFTSMQSLPLSIALVPTSRYLSITISISINCQCYRYIFISELDSSAGPVLFAHKEEYWQDIEDYSDLSCATVAKIDQAQTTKKRNGGKIPRLKRNILNPKKLEQFPHGLGIDSIHHMYQAEILKPPVKRYIQSCFTTAKGKTSMLTFVPFLLKLLDNSGVTSFEGDTTYAGIDTAKLNEWELTIFAKLFDELQRMKLVFTGRPIPFKQFVCGGQLLVTNLDMDTAQVLGLCRSVLKFSDPKYSGIPKDTNPEDIAPLFIKICWRHAKEPVHDLKSLVSADDFARLMEFVYIDSKEALDNTVQEIKMSLRTGILVNNNNEMSQRMSCNMQRRFAVAQKMQASHVAQDISHQIQLQIDAETEKQCLSKETSKVLKAQLKELKTKASKGQTSVDVNPVPTLPMQSLELQAPSEPPVIPTSITEPPSSIGSLDATVLPFHAVADFMYDLNAPATFGLATSSADPLLPLPINTTYMDPVYARPSQDPEYLF
ncbi:hypothetical protein R3P38DRAFT_2803445 [Favolaschia claudopus]|uniref:Uncharacterized protein n=1 Tax=Favolaschia claudopus TaxID=2862362 RepID=A0AAV9ZSP7_9AGAR